MKPADLYAYLSSRTGSYDWTKLDVANCYQWITTLNKVDENHGAIIAQLIIHSYVMNKLDKLPVDEQKKEIEGLLNNRRKQGVYGLRIDAGGKERKGLRMNFQQLPSELQQIILIYLFEYISESGVPNGLVPTT